jgi:Kdo2-lipid IVA lauroyltransferase/acyltransferase
VKRTRAVYVPPGPSVGDGRRWRRRMTEARDSWKDVAVDTAIRGMLGLLLALPYQWRVPAAGWIAARLVAPLAGWDRRIRDNLAYVCPELPAAEARRIARRVPDNAGRTLIEMYSSQDFARRVEDTPLSGPGAAALDAALAAGGPILLVTGHYGNYLVPRAALARRGIALGALYRPMSNTRFNEHYVAAMADADAPIFPATRRGLVEMIRFLARGNTLGVLTDIYVSDGATVTFFGKPAPTSTAVSEWALKYRARVFPIYGRRRDGGLDFDLIVDHEVPLTDAVTMTQAINDSLETEVRGHMDQWFWIHRRWKPDRMVDQRTRAAASTAP